jgi:hypothetical protein
LAVLLPHPLNFAASLIACLCVQEHALLAGVRHMIPCVWKETVNQFHFVLRTL